MTNSNYVSGSNFERRVKKRFEKMGYPLVVRAAGSHGVSDVTAIGKGEVVLNSCKANGVITPDELAEFKKVALLLRKQGGMKVTAYLAARRGRKIQLKDVFTGEKRYG